MTKEVTYNYKDLTVTVWCEGPDCSAHLTLTNAEDLLDAVDAHQWGANEEGALCPRCFCPDHVHLGGAQAHS